MSARIPLSACLLTFTLAAVFGASTYPDAPAAGTPRTIEITVNDQMKYDVPAITAKRGETLKIRLHATGTMPKNIMAHNLVVLKATTDVNAFVTKANVSRDTNYLPADLNSAIIAAPA